MAWCDLAIGHDTGMAELAAISYPSQEAAYAPPDTTSPVVTVFGRYDHDMWSISPRIHPVPSAASASMTAHNRSHVLTADEWDAWGANAEASSVNSSRYTEAIRNALARTGTTTQPTTSLTRAVAQLRCRTPPPPAAPPEDRIIEHAALSQLVTSLFDLNASNWTLEDQVRERYDDLEEVGRLKRLIDQHNRVRHRLIELIDDRALPATSTNSTTPVALETPGMLTDRLVVLAIRLWHLSATPPDSSTGRRRRTAERQWHTLINGLERLTNDLANGTIRCDVYRALKNYGSQHTS